MQIHRIPDRIFPAVLECRGTRKMYSGSFSMWGVEGNKSTYGYYIVYGGNKKVHLWQETQQAYTE